MYTLSNQARQRRHRQVHTIMHRISWKLYCHGNWKLRLHNTPSHSNDQHTNHSTRQSGTSNNTGPSTDASWLRWNSSCWNHNRITRPIIHEKETNTTSDDGTFKHAYAPVHNLTLKCVKGLVPIVKLDVLSMLCA